MPDTRVQPATTPADPAQASSASPQYFANVDACVEHILASVGKHVVLGIPLGIGKPNQLVNALYARVVAQADLHLTILTALSLEKPHGSSELEQRFIGPFVERVFGDYPDLEYVRARRGAGLPPNVRVIEFFVKTGDYLQNDVAQQDFISSNYTNAARDMLAQGVNVLAQAVAVDESQTDAQGHAMRISLSGNPDTTLDMFDLMKLQPARKVLSIACYNRKLPFMENMAAVSPNLFDCVLTDPASSHDLFAPPNMKVSLQDYAIGLYASTLVKDGGTLQIGIGSLGDAIAHSLLLRDKKNAQYQQMVGQLHGGLLAAISETGPFTEGLYGCSEMFVNGFLQMIKQGLIRREVFDDIVLQNLLNQRKISLQLRPDTLQVLQQEGVLGHSMRQQDWQWLHHFGILKPEVRWQDGQLVLGQQSFDVRQLDAASLAALSEHCLGTRLQHGIYMHGGFFLGPRDFYASLKQMPMEERLKIGMSRISRINSLYGHEALARLQRQHARFINTTMKVTLLGAASSDSLDTGRVVSGVGGQFNFVNMADALPDARSILMLRSTHAKQDKVWSNIVWSYSQNTIPRHLRDIVITEYGIADLCGQTDSQCVERLLAITDSRFQAELVAQAKQHGKLRADYQIPAEFQQNTPAALESKLRSWRQQGLLPDFPFGTDFTEDEIIIVKALKKLKASVGHPLELLKVFFNSFADDMQDSSGKKVEIERYLERMHMDELNSIKMRLLRRLFVGNLS